MPGLSVRERHVFAAKSSPITTTLDLSSQKVTPFLSAYAFVTSMSHEVVHVIPCVLPFLVCGCGDQVIRPT
jgi:hypothetical protein